jgi:hypothetical protein
MRASRQGEKSNLLALEQSIEYETGVRKGVPRYRVRLLHTASIGHRSLAHVWVTNVVIGSISPTMLEFRADIRGRRVRKVVVDFVRMSRRQRMFTHTGGRGRTDLDKFIFKLCYTILPSPIRVF